ncbi:MAG: SDR family NAD(P)-dependent oxidoreductase [Halomonadaceae bacterium]|nr:MAG: SDR family NAD(P)-dependent oxidoreductase [Halomonadaceae bacterium]
MMTTLIAGITGGIGHAMAAQLLADDHDAHLIGLARSASGNEELAELAARYPHRMTLLDADVANPEGLKQALQQLPKELKITRVIYAIGLLHDAAMTPEKRLADIDIQSMAHSYQVNTLGFLSLVQGLVPWLRHREAKTIVALSAKVGSLSDNRFGGWYAYRCSKAALNMAVRNLAIEAQRGLRPSTVIALHPGTTATPLSAPYQQSLAKLKVHTPQETARNLWVVIHSLTETQNGCFLNWDGSELPW